ncbi:hypothetical protein C8J57DRAFT_761371 [Mycena rebaudengoi]|nr:hypothetical protein C8J57DRAFT_761371 [Mycena rebaudengoi]
MEDSERGRARTTDLGEQQNRDESAAAKLWAIYIAEAEKYDKALVQNWRGDMEGILIFAGLFSASLTAFIIESYKTLSPDQGDVAVQILIQISRQLAAGATGSPVDSFEAPGFTPTTTSLACNILWFISLGFSLSCALIATLVEQWARDFIQKTDMRPSPVIRARIFSYLYYGLQHFNMHTVVELIPLLLHISLFLFFAGLVAFLHPVNFVVSACATGLLGILSVIYVYITVLPIFYSDCPYRTPLSTSVWTLVQWARSYPLRRRNSDYFRFPTMSEVMAHHATRKSIHRDQRDGRALVWTVKSLVGDEELEPFVEALPEVVWGDGKRRRLYDDQIITLHIYPDVQLGARIADMLRHSSNSNLLPPQQRIRRQITCLKALWATSHLAPQEPGSPQPLQALDLDLLDTLWASGNTHLQHHVIPTRAMIQWSMFRSLVYLMHQTSATLENLRSATVGEQSVRDIVQVLMRIQRRLDGMGMSTLRQRIFHSLQAQLPSESEITSWIPVVSDMLTKCEEAPHVILIHFLSAAGKLEDLPYEFEATRRAIMLADRQPSDSVIYHISLAMDRLAMQNTPATHHVDIITGYLLSLWAPTMSKETPRLCSLMGGRIVRYLATRSDDQSVLTALTECNPSALTSSLSEYLIENPTEAALEGIHRFCLLRPRLPLPGGHLADLGTRFDEQTLAAARRVPLCGWSASAIALIRLDMLMSYAWPAGNAAPEETAQSMTALQQPLLPSHDPEFTEDDTFLSQFTDLSAKFAMRYAEARWVILTEFLEACGSLTPHKAAETLTFLIGFSPSHCLQKLHQRRFAASLRALVDASPIPIRAPMMEILINSQIFMSYTAQAEPRGFKSLEDSEARNTIAEALSSYGASIKHLPLSQKIEEIVSTLRSLDAFEKDLSVPET